MDERKVREILSELEFIQEQIDHKKLEIHLLEQRQMRYQTELAEVTNSRKC